MRILLVRPPHPRLTIGLRNLMACEPLELELLAASVLDHEVRIQDMVLEKDLSATLRSFRPDIVGVTGYITGVNEALRVARRVKRHDRGCLVVAGGVHAAVVPEDWVDDAVDAIALCDGTAVLPAIASGRSLSTIPGLALPRNGALVRTETRSYIGDPDALPSPRRDLVAHLRNRYHYLHFRPVALLKTTWGCPHGCAFCFTRRVTGGQVAAQSPGRVVDEIARIVEPTIYVVDDDLFHDPERARAIALGLRERGIRKQFLAYMRADFVARNEDLVRLWAEVGLIAALVGLEACTDAGLAALGKSTTEDDNRRAIQVLRRHNVDIHALFVPSPDFGPEDWSRLGLFIRENQLYFINLTPLTPYPGTRLWDERGAEVKVPRQAHPLWDMVHPLLPARGGIQAFNRASVGLYLKTLLDPRAAKAVSHPPPPPTSPVFWQVLGGSALAAGQMSMSHLHFGRLGLALATWRGRPRWMP